MPADRTRQGIGSSMKYLLAVVILAVLVIGVIALGDLPRGEDAFETLLLVAGGFIVGILAIMWGFDEYRKTSLIRNTPTSKVRSMAMGLVEVKGTTRVADEPLESPFNGEDCVFYKYMVEEYKNQGKHSRWVTIDEGRNGASFYVDDGTGQVLVDPRGAELEIPADNVIEVDGGETPPFKVTEFIEEHEDIESEDNSVDLGIAEVDTGNDRRYTEYYVTPGEDVYVFGKAMERPSFEGSAQNEDNIVVNEDDHTPMFMISDSSEKELVSTMTWKTYGALIGGTILSIACFGFLIGLVGLL